MHTKMKSACFTIAFGAILALASVLTACAPSYDGEKLFFSVGCSQCHYFKGRGGEMAPDLTAVTNNRSDSWIDSYIQDPSKIYPLSRMPSFKHLSHAERKAIIAFLKK
jgi:cytochrome c2